MLPQNKKLAAQIGAASFFDSPNHSINDYPPQF
jgi:hypothetical protein